MKQIEICKLRNGVVVEKETYYVEHMDMFLRDTIDAYIDSMKELNTLRGINNVAYALKIVDVYVSDNYLLHKSIVAMIDKNKENMEKHKEFMKGLEKVMKKWYI